MIFVRQYTQRRVPLGNFFDTSDANTEETALVIAGSDIKLHKADATSLTNAVTGAVHMSNGVYYWTVTSGDVDTLGPLVAFCHPSGALAVRLEMMVVPSGYYDATFGNEWLRVDPFLPDWSVSGSVLTVKKRDGVTVDYTKTVSTNAAADPITGAD